MNEKEKTIEKNIYAISETAIEMTKDRCNVLNKIANTNRAGMKKKPQPKIFIMVLRKLQNSITDFFLEESARAQAIKKTAVRTSPMTI